MSVMNKLGATLVVMAALVACGEDEGPPAPGPGASGGGGAAGDGGSAATGGGGAAGAGGAGGAARGPLRVHPDNPAYLTDDTGRAVYLTGSHTWTNLQDAVAPDVDPIFDYGGFLDFLDARHHNFFRLWAWESTTWVRPAGAEVELAPLPFQRTGPGTALDGGPKYDVTAFDQPYFDRLRQRVVAAQERGLYVGVMLFQGFSVARKDPSRAFTQWDHHPYNAANNVNGIDGDPNGDGEGYETHTLEVPAVTALQDAYVRKVVDTLNDLDNIVYEVSNESHGASAGWQGHVIDLIHDYESTLAYQHPVWMSFTWDGVEGSGSNADLLASPAEIISPQGDEVGQDYKADPPPADGSKVVVSDTDHLWGVGGDLDWVWKSFTRGLHPIFMDRYRETPSNPEPTLQPEYDGARDAMGDTLRYAERVELAAMTPHGELTSTGYCLAAPGVELLVYQPAGGAFTMELAAQDYAVEWFDPTNRATTVEAPITGEPTTTLTPPFAGPAVLYLKASTGN